MKTEQRLPQKENRIWQVMLRRRKGQPTYRRLFLGARLWTREFVCQKDGNVYQMYNILTALFFYR